MAIRLESPAHKGRDHVLSLRHAGELAGPFHGSAARAALDSEIALITGTGVVIDGGQLAGLFRAPLD